MKQRGTIFWTGAVVMVLASVVWGLERFPPPDFVETQHVLPQTTTPAPDSDLAEYVDVVVLLAALALATYFVYTKRSRAWVFALTVFCLAYFGFYRKGCICPIGAIQNVTLTLFDATYAIPLTALLFFLLPLIFALFVGRVFCSGVCPLGAIQDLVVVHPVNVPRWLESGLRILAYTYLGAAVLFAATGSAFIICRYDPFVGFFRLSGNASVIILGVCLLVMGLFVGRPYCRFLCPYGVILRQLSRVSKRRVTITPNECIACRLCEDACPYGAIQGPESRWSEPDRIRGKKRLTGLLILVPVLLAGGAAAGYQAGPGLSRMHTTVRVAERVHQEESGQAEGTTDESQAFRSTGESVESLYHRAALLQNRFTLGGAWLGAGLGLILGLKLILVSVRRHRTGYEAEPAACLACARCYAYCPKDRDQRKKNRERRGASV